ncbi:MAG TPA: proline--tRNA ligase, partial [Parvularculaceae bacterium]|nr:proline--tRNA ligase [Parvularculaceae bacterium]
DLPKMLYHIQWKFRDEVRPRFGVMRGREFLMKDTYSFDADQEGARKSYNKMFVAYLRTFARMGLTSIPMRADTGPIGGDLSHEFIVLADTGESAVFCDSRLLDLDVPGADTDFDGDLQPMIDRYTSYYAATEEKHDNAEFETKVAKDDRVAARGIEVGHIFYFGDKYSAPMKAVVTGADGKDRAVEMGSYGVGVSRLVGAIIEAYHDEAGCKWPVPVAPFHVGLINIKVGDAATDEASAKAYAALEEAGVDVLYDDTPARPGEKFARMDLIGLPFQLIIGPRGLESGKVEIKRRSDGHRDELSLDAAIEMLKRDVASALKV